MTSPVNSSGAMISTFMIGCRRGLGRPAGPLFHGGHGGDAEGHLRGLAFFEAVASVRATAMSTAGWP